MDKRDLFYIIKDDDDMKMDKRDFLEIYQMVNYEFGVYVASWSVASPDGRVYLSKNLIKYINRINKQHHFLPYQLDLDELEKEDGKDNYVYYLDDKAYNYCKELLKSVEEVIL